MKRNRQTYYKISVLNGSFSRYLEEKEKGKRNILLTMADELDVSPALFARLILERHMYFNSPRDLEGNPVAPSRAAITSMMRDPTLIPDPVLAREIQECILDDDVYGPLIDTVKRAIGHEYEVILEKKIQQHNLAYLNETVLRAKGYDKTPDFKLEVPIAVDGHVVNWIESKASFGDEESHKGYLKDQFWSYWNRFGPGLVIYWFGFIEELDVHKEKGIILMDHFPTSIVTMEPTIVESS